MHRCVFSETQDSKDDHVESHNRANNKTKKLVVIAGDSIVKQDDENKVSRNKSIKNEMLSRSQSWRHGGPH